MDNGRNDKEGVRPLVSVILPAYNVGPYIEQSLCSVIGQDYPNLEIIVVDDGSTDETYSVAQAVLAATHRKSIVIRQANRGLSAARNVGIAASTGAFFICVDSDDLLVENAVTLLVDGLMGCRVKVAACNYYRFADKGEPVDPVSRSAPKLLSRHEALEGYCLRTLRIIVPGMLFDSSLKEDVTFDERVKFEEDMFYIWSMLFRLSAIAYVDAPLYGYRIRPGSIMTCPNLDDIESASGLFRDFFSDNAPDSWDWSLLYGRWILGVMHVIALASNYRTFDDMYRRLDAKTWLHSLRTFPQRRVRVLACISDAHARLLYGALFATRLLRKG